MIRDLCSNPIDNIVLEGFASFDTLAWYDVCSGDFGRKIFSVNPDDCDIIDFVVSDEITLQLGWGNLEALETPH